MADKHTKLGLKSADTKSLPSPSHAAIETAYKILITAMIDTNADTLKIDVDGFRDSTGKSYGDFRVKVSRKITT